MQITILELEQAVKRLLACKLIRLEPIGDGRNSQVYKVICTDRKCYALKVYFHHIADNRDRLETEFTSLRFLWENGVRDIPQPIMIDQKCGFAIYEYITGQKIAADEVTKDGIDTAVLFLSRLENIKGRSADWHLKAASEACFSIQEIVENIQARLSPLISSCQKKCDNPGLRDFIEQHFIPTQEQIIRWCHSRLNEARIAYDKQLNTAECTLSPSDFGFHNALRRLDGQLVFIDFEYFGWDDPAKMVVDFLLHPGMHLSDNLKCRFVHGILQHFRGYSHLAQRIEMVYPLFGLKWCLILLNEFLPEQLLRRKFAGIGVMNQRNLQVVQLGKAKALLQKLLEEYEHFPYFN